MYFDGTIVRAFKANLLINARRDIYRTGHFDETF